jgi:replication initiator protein
MISKIAEQLEMLGLDETLRRVRAEAATPAERKLLLRRAEVAHELMSELPDPDDLSFLHSGLCQTCLPHSRPAQDHAVWSRHAGRFSLLIQPGVMHTDAGPKYVGVPYGPKARLILIHLQTVGIRSRTVNLGASFSAFMRSLGLAVTGGQRGTIGAVREQSLRIAQGSFTMQWTENEATGDRTVISNTRIVDRFEFWKSDRNGWSESVELSEQFHAHLREHAVPLDKRGIAHLSANSLGLDLYALFAYRLPRLNQPVHLRWSMLQGQIGSSERTTNTLAQRVREVLPDVFTAYPHANVEVTPHGLLLKPSHPAVPKTTVSGFRLIEGPSGR